MEEQKKEEKADKIEVLFFHGETRYDYKADRNHRFTIAGTLHKDATKTFVLAITICSETDQFSKAEGRKRAEERLVSVEEKGRIYMTVNVKEGRDVKTFNTITSSFNNMSKPQLVELFGLRK
jgi:hypothetical protein